MEDSSMRDIPVKVGDPAQNIVVLPWAELNNTRLYGYDALCDTSIIFDDTTCRVSRGKFFFENESTSYEKEGSMVAMGVATTETTGHGAESGIVNLMTTSLAGSDIISPVPPVFSSQFALPVCIVPQRQLLIEAPESILDAFQNKTNTRTTGTSYGLCFSFQGDMLMNLSSGLQVTIPNSRFMPPFVTIERNGRRGFNEIQREFLYGVMTGRPSTLGRYFLTSTYLMVSHDEKPSTLRQANPSTATDLIPIISKDLIDNRANVINNGTMVVNGTLTIEPEASDTTGASPPATEAKSDKKVSFSHGALVGIAARHYLSRGYSRGYCLVYAPKEET
ncbi:hypothetical protein H4I95_09433 [Botrytis cinerea]